MTCAQTARITHTSQLVLTENCAMSWLDTHKKLFVSLLLVAALGGCASVQDRIENFFLSRWDSHEAALISRVAVQTHEAQAACDVARTVEQRTALTGNLYRTTVELVAYSKTLPDDNRPVIRVVENIREAAQELHTRAQGTMSRIYCENKVANIRSMSEQAQRVVQSKRR